MQTVKLTENADGTYNFNTENGILIRNITYGNLHNTLLANNVRYFLQRGMIFEVLEDGIFAK